MESNDLLKRIAIALIASGVLLLICAVYNEAQVEHVFPGSGSDSEVTLGKSESVVLYALSGVAFINGFVLMHASQRRN